MFNADLQTVIATNLLIAFPVSLAMQLQVSNPPPTDRQLSNAHNKALIENKP
jgi:hypothetical protein